MGKKILFRADGNSLIGLGHLYRLFGLVEIAQKNFKYTFITCESSALNVIPQQYNKKLLPNSINIENEAGWLAQNFNANDHIIIADGYQFNSNYQKSIKEKGFKLIYIDDLATEHMYADIVVNHSPYLKAKDFNKEPYTLLALGTSYAMLRPLFLAKAKADRKVDRIDKVFVCFGGSDPSDLTFKAVTALLQNKNFDEVHVVLGGAYSHNAIFKLPKTNNKKLNIYRNLSEEQLVEVMQRCNFAIAPASTILYELCCIKMPILSGYYVKNQQLIYNGFLDKKAIFPGGNMASFEVNDFSVAIENIVSINNFRNIIEYQSKLFDASIAQRHLKLIKQLC